MPVAGWSDRHGQLAFNDCKGTAMNKDQVKGRVEQAKGAVKEGTGKMVGNKKLQTEGQIDKASGKAQATYGDVKEDVKDAAKDVAKRLDRDDPLPPR
jgi:uncharacterized protein YjbJ (UPF0337 family)